MPGDDVVLTLELYHPVPLEPSQRFTLRDGHVTVGAGVFTEIIE